MYQIYYTIYCINEISGAALPPELGGGVDCITFYIVYQSCRMVQLRGVDSLVHARIQIVCGREFIYNTHLDVYSLYSKVFADSIGIPLL